MNPRDAEREAKRLMAQHGLAGWRFLWTRGKRIFGVCKWRSRVIGLSLPMTQLNGEAEVTNTILHEIAHALVGPGHGHGPTWKAMARKIGASAQRCAGEEVAAPEANYVALCPECREIRGKRYRRPKRDLFCTVCLRTRPKKPRPVIWQRA